MCQKQYENRFVLIDSNLFHAIMTIEDSGVTSYRGYEADDCVGMQPSVEPARGLCENHKPNRFFGIERKRIKGFCTCKTLCFSHQKGVILISTSNNILYQAASVWKNLTEYRYIFTYGYKKQLYTINLAFSMGDFPHLAGFQYLKDLALPRYNPSQTVNRILEHKIRYEQIIKGVQYEEMVKPRLEALVHLEDILNNEFLFFSYMPKMYPFTTTIKADYLISSHLDLINFVFIIQNNNNGNSKCDYLCCSAFAKGERNYEANQRPLALLRKERIHIPTNTSLTIIDKLNPS